MKNMKEVIIIHNIHEKSKYCFPTTKYMENIQEVITSMKNTWRKSLLFTTSMKNLNIVFNNQIHENMKEVIIIHNIHVKSKYCFQQPNTWKTWRKSLLFTTSMINLNIVSNNQIHEKHEGSHYYPTTSM